MVSQELLKVLICPSCRGDLQYDREKETLTCLGRHCSACGMAFDDSGSCGNPQCVQRNGEPVGLSYRVEEDIPVMLIDEAERISL